MSGTRERSGSNASYGAPSPGKALRAPIPRPGVIARGKSQPTPKRSNSVSAQENRISNGHQHYVSTPVVADALYNQRF
jgi:hypothetical protein